MQKLIIKLIETDTTLLASVSNNSEESLREYAGNWIREKGYPADKVNICVIAVSGTSGTSGASTGLKNLITGAFKSETL